VNTPRMSHPTAPQITAPQITAPLARLLRSELRWVFRRPRTIVALVLLSGLPVAIGIGVALTGGPSGGPTDDRESLIAQVAGNGLVLPVASLASAIFLLLPLVVSMSAADALAGESAHGTLRGLLLAPVGRIRLVMIKSLGVLAVAIAGVVLIAGVGVLTGLLVVGGVSDVGEGGNGVLTLSGTSLPVLPALWRVALAALWTVVQLAAIGAVALAVSSVTDHPLVVLAVTVGGLIVIGVLSVIPALDWLRPVLLPTGWEAIADVLRDPVPWDGLLTTSYRAACYLLIGVSLTLARMVTRDA
jgi:ABC-2 type transport system permease protein